MSLLSRLFGSKPDDREPMRPLWHRVVEVAREKEWYSLCGAADTVAGRFDMVTLVLAAVLLRMERDAALVAPSVRLTELFVEDMDGQLRNSGVGDLSVGKHIGKLMGVLGGRLGALRDALTQGDTAIAAFADRNVTLAAHGDSAEVADRLKQLIARLDESSAEDLLAARMAP